MFVEHVRRLLPISYEQAGQLAYNLATCVAAGVPTPQGFRTSTRSWAARDPIWETMAESIEHGSPLSDALQPIAWRLPPFYVPLIAVGEQTGQLDEILLYLSQHCRMLAPPLNALRSVWRTPLIIYLLALPLEAAMVLILGRWSAIPGILGNSILRVGPLVATAIILLFPPLRPVWDRLRLWIPFWGKAERDMNVSRFFRVLSLVYSAGGRRVENMLHIAASSVSNDHVKTDLLSSVQRIERGSNLTEALGRSTVLLSDEIDQVATGELAGKLESTCMRIAQALDDSLETRCKVMKDWASRVAMFMLMGSILSMVMRLVWVAIM